MRSSRQPVLPAAIARERPWFGRRDCGSSPASTLSDSAFPVDAAAGSVEGGKLHDAAMIGDLAAVQARPPASTACASCSFALSRPRPQRLLTPGWFWLLTPGWFSGPPSVNEKDDDGYAPVGFFPSAPCRNSTQQSSLHALTNTPCAEAHASPTCERVTTFRSFHGPA